MRAAGDFTRVIADDALDVEITIGPRASIELEGDDNLIDRIRTDAEDGALHLRVRGGYRVRQPMVARITMPRLDRVDLQASGDAGIGGLSGGRSRWPATARARSSRAAAVHAAHVRIQGSGDANPEGLRAREARILINGSATPAPMSPTRSSPPSMAPARSSTAARRAM